MNYLINRDFSLIDTVDSLWFVIIALFFIQILYFIFYNRKCFVLCFSLFSVTAILSYLDFSVNYYFALFGVTLSLFFLYSFLKHLYVEDNVGRIPFILIFSGVIVQFVLSIIGQEETLYISLFIILLILIHIFVKSVLSLINKREGAFFVFISLFLYQIALINLFLYYSYDKIVYISSLISFDNLFFPETFILILLIFNLIHQYFNIKRNVVEKNKAIADLEKIKIEENYRSEFLTTAASETEIIVKRIENHSAQIQSPGELNKLLKEVHRLSEYVRNMNLFLYSKEKSENNILLETEEIKQEESVEKSRRDLYSSISHDLRTPLTSIKGYIEAILDGVVEEPEAKREYLERVRVRVNGLIKLVEELSTIVNLESKNSAFDFQQIPAADFINKIYDRFYPEISSAGINFYKEINEEINSKMVIIKIDYHKMERVFGNLISNAIRYSKEGGIISIRGEMENNELLISLMDTGSGISKEDMPYIFNRFFTEKRNRSSITGNSGLGLAIAKDIIESHNGKIWAESEKGKGTIFFIKIPFE
jgi:signal transduction histidine kinase